MAPGRGPDHRPTPVDRGFDDYFGMLDGFGPFWNPRLPHNWPPADRPARIYPQAGAFYATDAFTDHAVDFLATAGKTPDRPFFLYPRPPRRTSRSSAAGRHRPLPRPLRDRLGSVRTETARAHAEARPARPTCGAARRGPGFETRGDFYRSGDNPAWDAPPADRRADLARRMAVYAAMVDRMDQGIGRVVAELKRSGRLDNTLILFLSDNGACAEWDPFGFDAGTGPKNVLHTGAALERMGQPGTYHSYGSGWANACNMPPFRWHKHYGHEGVSVLH
ncbi:MAG: sulfatase-like hydrolase/transferase [Gemmataceae bacterium]